MEESDAEREESLYEPIRAALQEKFRAKGSCRLEITARQISEEVKRGLDSAALLSLKSERMIPDMMGYLELNGLLIKHTRLVIVEVKRDQLALKDIYQLKMYAEVLRAYYAFLISPSGFREEQKRVIASTPDILATNTDYRGGEVSVMYFVDGVLNLDEELCNKNPFESELLL